MPALLRRPILRPYLLLAALVLLLVLAGGERVLNLPTLYSVLQQFSLLGPVALALGMTMMIRHFDLSVAGMVTLAGCIAVLTGAAHPLAGLGLAALAGLAAGALQGLVVVRLRLSSIGVTLGGMLTLIGLAYLMTGGREIAYARADVATLVDAPLWGAFSPRFLLAAAIFALASLAISVTRLGPQLLSVGSDARAALVAGVSVGVVTVAVFALSGLMSAASGTLLSYSLGAASPKALSNILVPAAAAAIIGGVSLGGGRGHPLGIAGGALVLCTLRSGLTAISVAPFVQDLATGIVLLVVAILDGAELRRRLDDLARLLGRSRPA